MVPAIALTSLTVPILDERGWMAAAWLLPSLALSTAALALSTWIRVEAATLAVGAVWLATPVLVRPEPGQLIDLIAGRAQAVALVVVVVATAVVVVRRDTFEYQVLP